MGVKAAIRLRLRITGDMPFNKLALERLVFFLGGAEGARMRLYEQLICNAVQVHVRPDSPPAALEREPAAERHASRLGFDADEALLPRLPQSFDGYRLLQEYYAMPERFLFVAIEGLDRAAIRCATNEMDVVILLDRADPALASSFAADHMLLFCAPVINLFPRRSDRINLNDRDAEYQIVPDRMRPLDFEVFDVQSVEAYASDGTAPQKFLPFYAANDLSRNPDHRSYFTLRRQPRQLSSRSRQRGPRSSYLGHDVFISLVDGDHAPINQNLRQLGLDLLCTNRDLPLSMPVGRQQTDFTILVSAPVASIRCVHGPVAPRPCRSDGDYAWRFISHLSLNYLSLADTDDLQGAAALRELLRLYVPIQPVDRRPPTRRRSIRRGANRSSVAFPVAVVHWLPGVVSASLLTMDEAPFGGSGAVLLASVLERFFAKYVSINGFTETSLRCTERGDVMRWPLRLGHRPVL